jgi:hypothetical protein
MNLHPRTLNCHGSSRSRDLHYGSFIASRSPLSAGASLFNRRQQRSWRIYGLADAIFDPALYIFQQQIYTTRPKLSPNLRSRPDESHRTPFSLLFSLHRQR